MDGYGSRTAPSAQAAEEAAAEMAAALAAKDLEVSEWKEKTREREREAAGIMKAQARETDKLRSETLLLKTALQEAELGSAGLLEEKSELELLYSRGDGAAQRQIAELQTTLLEAASEQAVAAEQLSVLRGESSEWQKEKATMEISLREAAGAWEALGQQETELKDYTVLKRERDDIHAKLAIALSVTKDAEGRADKAERSLESTKKKRGKLANGAAKQWDKERSEMEAAMMADRAQIDELHARIDLYETQKQVLEQAQVKLKAKLEACLSADAASQDLAEAHTATLEQNRKLVADLVAAQGFERDVMTCRSELASARSMLKKEVGKRESLAVAVEELETARNILRMTEGEKGVVMAQLREQVHTWKTKAEQRKVKTANLAKELTVTKQALDAAVSSQAICCCVWF